MFTDDLALYLNGIKTNFNHIIKGIEIFFIPWKQN